METRIRELQKQIDSQSYTSNGSRNAEKVATRLSKYYSELDELRMPKTEANKLRHLRGRINMGGGLKEPYYISVWQGAVNDAILEHMSEGMDIDYAHWTTHLVNDEANFKKNTSNDSALFQVQQLVVVATTVDLQGAVLVLRVITRALANLSNGG